MQNKYPEIILLFPFIIPLYELIPFEKNTEKYNSYYRYSAFPIDHRVDEYGNLAKGTYASTYNDTQLIASGFSATGRYALPNPDTAKFVFIILPPEKTKILIRTVSPAFLQSGGGVEVFFPDGAKNQLGQPYLIPES